MKKMNLVALIVMVSANILMPISYAQTEVISNSAVMSDNQSEKDIQKEETNNDDSVDVPQTNKPQDDNTGYEGEINGDNLVNMPQIPLIQDDVNEKKGEVNNESSANLSNLLDAQQSSRTQHDSLAQSNNTPNASLILAKKMGNTAGNMLMSKNGGNSVTVIYNANGGYFKNNASEKIVTYQKDDNTNKYVASENIQFPNKAANGDKKYMFAGWYLESGESTNQTHERYTQDVELEAVGLGNTKIVYARWLEFEDLPIEIGGKVVAIIMDRNLGAEAVADGTYYNDGGHEDYSKLGYYYQWGNNYGFKNNGDLPYSDLTNSSNNNRVDVDAYGPNNYYSNSTFKKIQDYPSIWTKNNNLNLWGGENSANPDIDKQGPCPEGYHVPDIGEWQAIYKFFDKERSHNEEYCEDFGENEKGKCFASKLQLPFAGIRSYFDSSIRSQGQYGYYWASFPFKNFDDNNTYPSAYRFGLDSYSVGPNGSSFELANGFSVRCFRNSLPKTLTLFTNNDESQEISVRWRESAMDKIKSLNLSKEGKFIIGWYKDSEFTEERDFNKDIVDSDMNLYAKWVEGGIEYLEGQGLIRVLAGDKEYYIRDRNVGVDENVDVRGKTKKIVDCMLGDGDECEENILNGIAKELGGKIYFWGNSSGVKVKNIEVDENYKIISDLPNRFNGGNSNNDGWLVGNSDNPCNADKGEYLPTIDDRLNIMKIYGAISGYQLGYEMDDSGLTYMYKDEDNILEIIADQLQLGISSPGVVLLNESDGSHLYSDPYGYSFTAKDDEGYIGVHFAYGMLRKKIEGMGNELIDDELFSAAVPIRCFVDTGKLVKVEFNSKGGSTLVTQFIVSGNSIEEPNVPTKDKNVFIGWYTDENLTNGFNFSIPITSDMTLYAKWEKCRDGFIVRDNQCVQEDTEGIFYKEGYIKISNGNKAIYVKDRNQGAEMTGFIPEGEVVRLSLMLENMIENGYTEEEAMNSEEFLRACSKLLGKTVTSAVQAEEEIMRLMEEQPYGDERSLGNFYFWGNNSGVNYKDLFLTDEDNSNSKIVDLTKSKLDNGFLELGKWGTDEGNGWKEGNTDNPCNIASGEYLPTTEDWIDLLEIYSDLNSYPLQSETFDEGGIVGWNDKMELGQVLAADMLMPGGGIIYQSDCDGNGENCNSMKLELVNVPYYQSAESNTHGIYFIGYGIYYLTNLENDEVEETIQELSNMAMPVRCFMKVHKVNFDSNGGSDIVTKEIVYNQTIEELPTPTKNGEIFGGWYTDSELTNVFTSSTPVTSDLTLYAKWIQGQTSTSSYSGGGGGGKRITKTDIKEHKVSNEKDPTQEETKGIENTKTSMDSPHSVQNDSNTQRQNNSSESANYSAEMNQAYIFAKSHGITTKSTIKTAKMNTPLTRIQMAKMLSQYAINVMGKTPDISKGVAKFDDVTNKMDKQYDNGVTLAYQLGIMGINMKNNNFRPYETVTRAQFATALSRMIYDMDEGRYTSTPQYYTPHINRLLNEGIINKANPSMQELRGYVMLMLMRSTK